MKYLHFEEIVNSLRDLTFTRVVRYFFHRAIFADVKTLLPSSTS